MTDGPYNQNYFFSTIENDSYDDYNYSDLEAMYMEEDQDSQYQDLESSFNNSTQNDTNLENTIVQNEMNVNNSLQKENNKKSKKKQNSSKILKNFTCKRSHKRQIKLPFDSTKFQKQYYKMITGGKPKRARKELICIYHKMICEKYKNIRSLKREEYRQINNYFNGFANQQNIILKAIKELIDEGKIDYEKDYKKYILNNNK